MKINRIWVMPSKWTFTMPPVVKLLAEYDVATLDFADPFAGENSTVKFTNDIEGRGNLSQDDGLHFLTRFSANALDGVLFDPPYSVEQCLRKYTSKHGGTAGRAEYWAKCKIEIARIIRPGGYCFSFGWDSTGVGKTRGFEIEEILLLCHGACHNDTIITIDRKKG